jgi:hypothetical protein
MKLRFAIPLLFIALAEAQQPAKPATPAPATKSGPPTISKDEQLEFSNALIDVMDAQAQMEHLLGYLPLASRVDEGRKKLFALQSAMCKSTDGKQYQLDRSTDPKTKATTLSCKEVPAQVKK